MRGYGQLTLAQLRLFVRNRQVIFWTLFFPLFLMVMLGSFLGNGNQVTLNAVLIHEDEGGQGDRLVNVLLASDVLSFAQEEQLEPALDQLKNGEVQMVVRIPPGYGKEVRTGERPAAVDLYYNETNMMVNQIGIPIVEGIVDGFSKEITGYEPAITVRTEGVQSLELKYIDFLVPGIVAMMIMSNNLNGVAGQIASWRERGVLRRMRSTTLNASTFIASQITARLLLNGLQAVIVLLIGNWFFGTQVNGSWPLLLFFVVLGTLAFMSIGFIIAGLAKTPESAGPIAGFVSFPLLFLGGVFFPIDNMPDFLQPLVKSLPIAQLSTALREVMNVGAALPDLWLETVLLCGWLVGAFIVASLVFRWD